MIILRNINTGLEFEYEDSLGALLLKNNKFDFELVNATKEQKEKIEEETIPTDEALIMKKAKRKK